MRLFLKVLFFGFSVALLATAMAAGPAMMIGRKFNDLAVLAASENLVALLATSIMVTGWLLVSRSVWRQQNRIEVSWCVFASYAWALALGLAFRCMVFAP